MSWMERFPILVWAGAALLGRVAGEIIIEDPAIVGWLGEATAHRLHSWAMHIGTLLVVAVGLLLVRKRRPLVGDEIWAGPGIVAWIVGEVIIQQAFAAEAMYARITAYALLMLLLAVAYTYVRKVSPIEVREV